MVVDLAKKKWRNHTHGARRRGINWLTLDEYRDKLKEAGITPEQVGRASHQYHLARWTDKGDYTPASCRFVTVPENHQDRIANGGSARTGEKNRAHRKGMTAATHEHIAIAAAKSSAARKGRTKESHSYIAAQAERLAKPYSFLSPEGVVYLGKNLCEFCRVMNLSQSLMTAVREGRQRHHKGWTLCNGESAAPTGPAQPESKS